MSCDEYDAYLSDPLHFRSDHERQVERARLEARELAALRRARVRVERVMRHRWGRATDGDGDDNGNGWEAGRREQVRHDEEEEQGRAEAEAERRRRAAGEIQRRRAEDLLSERTVEVSTKGCPRCAARIEKAEGW